MPDSEKQWWKEDADRVNKMCQLAAKNKAVVNCGDANPPELNEDGSLKEDKNEDSVS